jgi:hypothetical protein
MTAPDDIQPLLVRPRKAWRILDCGNTRGYELLAKRELDSFVDGRARWITTDSIRRYIERRLAQSGVSSAAPLQRRSNSDVDKNHIPDRGRVGARTGFAAKAANHPLVDAELREQTKRRPPNPRAKRSYAPRRRKGGHTGVVL